MVALRACAEARVSRVSMAAPSPMVMPSRSAEKGRHWGGGTTRMESQARREPKVNGASWPPVTAASTIPLRTIWKARPMAWVPEEQAVEMLRVGPVIFWSMEMLLAPAEAMGRGTVGGGPRAPGAQGVRAGGGGGELRGGVGGEGGTGLEVFARIEVFYCGGLGEAEALGLVVSFAAGSFGVGGEGSEGSGPVEEGG